MNKTLAISAIAMFAVLMGISAIAPALAVPPAGPPEDVPTNHCEALDNPHNSNATGGIANATEASGCI